MSHWQWAHALCVTRNFTRLTHGGPWVVVPGGAPAWRSTANAHAMTAPDKHETRSRVRDSRATRNETDKTLPTSHSQRRKQDDRPSALPLPMHMNMDMDMRPNKHWQ